jgi:hypothetical protein
VLTIDDDRAEFEIEIFGEPISLDDRREEFESELRRRDLGVDGGVARIVAQPLDRAVEDLDAVRSANALEEPVGHVVETFDAGKDGLGNRVFLFVHGAEREGR